MRVAAIVVSFGLCAAPGLPQATSYGELFGVVRDAQGLVLPGASVSLRGTGDIGARATQTDRNGVYHFRALSPGEITVSVAMPGFTGAEKTGIVMRAGASMVASFTLEIAGVSEEVRVEAAGPGLDPRTTRVRAAFDDEALAEVPTATDMWSVLAQSPGIRMRGYDVGGSHKMEQSRYETFGIREQNRIVSDGVDSTEGVGGAGIYYDFYAVDEFQVSGAGADVTMTGPGASVVMTIKGGGDALSGLFHLDYEGEGMVGDNTTPELEERQFTGNPNLLLWETHADLGGPIARGKAWFYGAYNHFQLNKEVSGVDPSLGTDDATFNNFTGKATFALSENDRLIGYSQWGQKVRLNRGLSLNQPASATRDQRGWSYLHKLEWQRTWSPRIFGTVRFAHWGLYGDFLAKPEIEGTDRRIDLSQRLLSGSPGDVRIERSKPQIAAQLDYYLPTANGGGHDIKLGFDWMVDEYDVENRANDIFYRDDPRVGRPSGASEVQFWANPWTNDIVNNRLDVYFQDRFTLLDRLTVTAGARLSRQHVFYHEVTNTPTRSDFFSVKTFPGRTLQTWFDVAPRLGATVDLNGRGNTVLKAYYGRFAINLANSLSSAHPAGPAGQAYDFLDPNGNGLYDGPHELGDLFFAFEAEPDALNEELEHSFAEEVSFSLERELGAHASVRVSYVHKSLERDFGLWNVAQGRALLSSPVPCGDEIFPCPNHPFTGEPLSLVRLPEPFFDAQEFRVETYPNARNSYDTLEVAYTQRPLGRLWIQAGFDYQWRDELRTTGLTTNPLVTDPLNVRYFQNHNPSVANRQTSTGWALKALGRVSLPRSASVSVNFRHQSGFPWAPIHTVRVPGSGFQDFFLEDISENRSDNVTLLDVRAEKSFALAEGHRLSVMVDAYNLLNTNAEINFIQWVGPGFRDLLGAIDPITVKVGLRWQF